MTEATDRHNAAIYPVMALMIDRVGPDPAQLLVLAEALVCGLFRLIVRLGGDEPALDAFTDRLRTRLAEQRLGDVEPDGRA